MYNALWRATSAKNTKIFSQVFPAIPRDGVSTLDVFESLKKQSSSTDVIFFFFCFASIRFPIRNALQLAFLSEVRGHLVDFPLQFLRREALAAPVSGVILDKAVFQ